MVSETLQKVLDRYDGPILVARLAHIALRTDDADAHLAAFHALCHLDANSQFSPLIEQLINKANRLEIESDEMLAHKFRFEDPSWIPWLQNHKNEMLRRNNAEALYHERDISKNIAVATIYMYNQSYPEASSALASTGASDHVCTLAEYASQVGILQGNNIHVSSQEKRIEHFLSNAHTSDLYKKRLTVTEVTAYWRTKYLILFSFFLKQNFEEVVNQAYQLVAEKPIVTVDGKSIDSLSILRESDFNKFIHKEEIIVAIVISILLHRPSNELNDVLSEPAFVALMGDSISEVRPFFVALANAQFKKLFGLIEEMSPAAESSFLLNKVWGDIKLKFRRKAYMLYLSLVRRVKIDHLAMKLNINHTRLLRELKDLVKDEKLEFEFSNSDTILEAVRRDKLSSFVERLEKLAEQADAIENDTESKIIQQKPFKGFLEKTGNFASSVRSGFIDARMREATKTPPGEEEEYDYDEYERLD